MTRAVAAAASALQGGGRRFADCCAHARAEVSWQLPGVDRRSDSLLSDWDLFELCFGRAACAASGSAFPTLAIDHSRDSENAQPKRCWRDVTGPFESTSSRGPIRRA